MDFIRDLDEEPLMINELNQGKALSKPNRSISGSKAEKSIVHNLETEEYIGGLNERVSEMPKLCHLKRMTPQPQWTEQVRIPLGTGLEESVEDGYSWKKYGQKKIVGTKYPRSYYQCTHGSVDRCPAKRKVQRSEDDPSILEVTYLGKHICTRAFHPIPNLPPPNEQNQNQNQQQILSPCSSKGIQSSQLQSQSETPKSTSFKEPKFMVASAVSTSSTGSPRHNPELEIGISCGNVFAPNVMIGDITSAASTPSTGSPGHNPEVQVGISCGNAIEPNVVIGDITSAASTPSIGPPQSNPEVDVGISCGNAIALNVVTGDVTSAASLPTGSPRSNPEVEVGIMGDITSVASTLSIGSPRHNPEVELGISCGNLIAPNMMRGGFHNHNDEQEKQVQSGDANQTHLNSDILQVSETGTNVVVITGETMERQMNGKDNESDSTIPIIEPQPRSGCCCRFRCFCHCHIGFLE